MKVKTVFIIFVTVLIILGTVMIYQQCSTENTKNNCEHEWHLFCKDGDYKNYICKKCNSLKDDNSDITNNRCYHSNYEFDHIEDRFTKYYCPDCLMYWTIWTDMETGEESMELNKYDPDITENQFLLEAAKMIRTWGIYHDMKVPASDQDLANQLSGKVQLTALYYSVENVVLYTTRDIGFVYTENDKAYITVYYNFDTKEFNLVTF